MPTPFGVNSYFSSCNILQIGDLVNKNQKWMFKSYMSSLYFFLSP